MLSDAQIAPLAKALKWLSWLIGAALILLMSSIASFTYMRSDADNVRLGELKMIETDTLSREALKNIISLDDLLAAPEKYHDTYVCVKGYLNLEFEGDALYGHTSDYFTHAYKNSCWVEFSDSLSREKRVLNYSKHYVVVEGIFDANRQGHMSLSSGEIRAITSLHTLQKSAM